MNSRMTLGRAGSAAVASLLLASAASASTLAHWRFEAGPADTNVSKGATPGGITFHNSVADSSGSGNDLSVWDTGGGAGFVYRANTPGSTVPQTGAANNFSVQNTGGGPAFFTQTGGALQSWSSATFTFEVSYKPENNNGWRTIIGRDSRGAATVNGDLAAMYFQITNSNEIAFKYADVSGVWHEVLSPNNIIQRWNFSGGSPNDIPWQHLAAVGDGSRLKLYYNNGAGYSEIANVPLNATADARMSAGTGDGGDWDAGIFSVGRGLYGGGHGDRAYGLIDEVRISDSALSIGQLLHTVPEPTTAVLGLLGLLGLRRRR